jgi:hypothetical protein
MTKSSATFSTTNADMCYLTDAEIDALIESDSMTFGGILGSEFDVKSNLFGDDYADAILADLGNISGTKSRPN